MGQLVSKSGFARMNGWVPSYVSQLNKEGRLVLDASGKKKVDVEATMALLGKTADPARSGVGDRHARERVERNIMPAAILAAAAEEAADTDGGDLPPTVTTSRRRGRKKRKPTSPALPSWKNASNCGNWWS